MNVNSILTKDYERNDIFAVPENKANSNPIKPNSRQKIYPFFLITASTSTSQSAPKKFVQIPGEQNLDISSPTASR